jgi:NAD-dependent SIR2 family protein deacetylase
MFQAVSPGVARERTLDDVDDQSWRQPDDAAIQRVARVLGDRTWLVLGGAGVSTDSGIPDYRGPGSPARTPMTYQDFIRTPEGRQRYWARAHVGWSRMREAHPNATHYALADLERAGRLTGLITQNVDGLHRRAGHQDVIDLHGRIDRVICLQCRDLTPRADLHARLSAADFRVAECTTCGGDLKPDVVFFGENVPKERVARSYALVEQAEALVVLGSSLQVMSGLRFVRAAHKRGIPVVIINRGTTRGDDLATVKVESGCAETVAALMVTATTWQQEGAHPEATSPGMRT